MRFFHALQGCLRRILRVPSGHVEFTADAIGVVVDWMVDNCVNVAHLWVHVALPRPVWILTIIFPLDFVELVLQTGIHLRHLAHAAFQTRREERLVFHSLVR